MAAITTGPFLAACAVLGVAGAAKLRDPRPTVLAARAAGLPASAAAVRVLGAAELAVAAAGAALGGAAAAAVAAAYLALAAVAVRLVRRAPRTPCGCLGASAAPATWVHVAVDGAAAVFAAVAVAAPPPPAVVADQPLHGVPFLVLVACAARLAGLLLDAHADLRVAIREGSA
ncbi:MAG: hypothetical protein KatS3mg009_1193 [Acidimicrobiia bacterium]|nr:MAG: hypothetical protein KatS3mg009_1193 [Acidimicrobiia bacterium]